MFLLTSKPRVLGQAHEQPARKRLAQTGLIATGVGGSCTPWGPRGVGERCGGCEVL